MVDVVNSCIQNEWINISLAIIKVDNYVMCQIWKHFLEFLSNPKAVAKCQLFHCNNPFFSNITIELDIFTYLLSKKEVGKNINYKLKNEMISNWKSEKIISKWKTSISYLQMAYWNLSKNDPFPNVNALSLRSKINTFVSNFLA